MKNKIVLNVVIIYLLIFTTIIIFQLDFKEINAVEPLSIDIKTEDKLKNAVVLAIDSPITIVNEKQFLIDEKDETITPKKIENDIYIPIEILKKIFGANINFDKNTNELIIRFDNKAIVLSKYSDTINIIYNTSKEEIISKRPKIINDRFYISIKTFTDLFEKEIFMHNDLIIISNIENIFDKTKEKSVLDELSEKLNTLPLAGSYDNMRNIPINNTKTIGNINTLINIDELNTLLNDNERVMIKKANGYNVYATNEHIELYLVNNKQETFIGEISKINNEILDIQLLDDYIIASYYENGTKTDIYKYTNNEMQFIANLYQEGKLYKNTITDNKLVSISKLNYEDNKYLSPEYHTINKNNKQEIYMENTENIQYFPAMNDNKYTFITYIDLDNINDDNLLAKHKTYIGMGENIIIKNSNIYVITENGENNVLHLIELTNNGIKYTNKQEIYGNFLNMTYDENVITIHLEDEKQMFDKETINKIGE